jgi:hypothetical protein
MQHIALLNCSYCTINYCHWYSPYGSFFDPRLKIHLLKRLLCVTKGSEVDVSAPYASNWFGAKIGVDVQSVVSKLYKSGFLFPYSEDVDLVS